MLNIHSRKHKNCSTKVCQNKTNPTAQATTNPTGLSAKRGCGLVENASLVSNRLHETGCLQSKPKIFGTHIKSIQGHSRAPKERAFDGKALQSLNVSQIADLRNPTTIVGGSWLFIGFFGMAFLCSYLKTDFQEDQLVGQHL